MICWVIQQILVSCAVNQITMNREQIKRKLAQSIEKVASIQSNKVDKHKLEEKIENLRKKKIRIIDLAAEGAISAADMKEQNEVYTSQIANLTSRLAEAENGFAESCNL